MNRGGEPAKIALGLLKLTVPWPDMNAYAEAKGPLITEITARAEKWATRSGWTV